MSGDSDDVMLGNFIGDYVKGQHYLRYPAEVQRGILLHRAIDSFTDSHPAVREAAAFFRPAYGRWAGIVTDVMFDHFLARHWQSYSPCTLRQFAKHVHAVLLSNFFQLPARVKGFLPFLIQHKRLESYARPDGIEQSLRIMAHRTSLPDETSQAMAVLDHRFAELNELFSLFFAELTAHAETNFGVRIEKAETVPGAGAKR